MCGGQYHLPLIPSADVTTFRHLVSLLLAFTGKFSWTVLGQQTLSCLVAFTTPLCIFCVLRSPCHSMAWRSVYFACIDCQHITHTSHHVWTDISHFPHSMDQKSFGSFFILFWQELERDIRGFGLFGRNRACCISALLSFPSGVMVCSLMVCSVLCKIIIHEHTTKTCTMQNKT